MNIFGILGRLNNTTTITNNNNSLLKVICKRSSCPINQSPTGEYSDQLSDQSLWGI